MNERLSAVREAALALSRVRRVLFSTGAGMSADSNIPTYRDEEGRWRRFEPFASRGLTPSEFAHPPGFRERPEHAWAFHEWLRRRVAANAPHPGYAALSRWVNERLEDSFVLTTNVDGMHLRAGIPEVRLCERYGSQWELQCLSACTPRFWPDHRVPLCQLDEERLVASRFPSCPYCGGLARPRVQMAHDPEFIAKDYDWQRYQNFRKEGEPELLVVIGTTLWFSWPEEVTPPLVISINPDPTAHAHYQNVIGLSMGAEDALTGIDWMLGQL